MATRSRHSAHGSGFFFSGCTKPRNSFPGSCWSKRLLLSHSRELSYIVWFELRGVGLSEVTFVKNSTLSMQKRFNDFFPRVIACLGWEDSQGNSDGCSLDTEPSCPLPDSASTELYAGTGMLI